MRRFKRYAIDGADRQAEFTTRAIRLDHGMHAFIAAKDRIRRTRVNTQRTPDAPRFINKGNGARAFNSKSSVEWFGGPAGDIG